MPSPTRSSSSRKRRAATQIQKRFRGKQTRKQVTKLKAKYEDVKQTRKQLIKLRASRKIQSRVRGKQTRKKLINNSCPICLEPMIHNVSITSPCNHKFHSDCIRRSLTATRGTCPLCRTVVTNIPYSPRSESESEEEEEEYEPLILDPILRRPYILERTRQLDLWERAIVELRPHVPDQPEIPNITFNDALINQYSADQTEYYVRRLYNEASYNYNNFRSLNINDEILEHDVTTMFFRTSELLTLARDNSRNAERICSHIANIEFAQYM
jgi:hypothetical protein